MSQSIKFYKTLKDLPTIEVGAILEYRPDYDEDYTLVDSLWEKDNMPDDQDVHIAAWNVEGSPDFYQQVYKLKDGTYGSKDQARAELNVAVTPGQPADGA